MDAPVSRTTVLKASPPNSLQLEGELQQLSQHADSARSTSTSVRARLGAFQGLLLTQTEPETPSTLTQLQQAQATVQQQTQQQWQMQTQTQTPASLQELQGAGAVSAMGASSADSQWPSAAAQLDQGPVAWTPSDQGVRAYLHAVPGCMLVCMQGVRTTQQTSHHSKPMQQHRSEAGEMHTDHPAGRKTGPLIYELTWC